jgi:DNA-binding Xre family transcriptional regulator
MSISFKKLNDMLENLGMQRKDIVASTMNFDSDIKSGKIHPNVMRKIQNGGTVNTDTINKLCKILRCQPGDIMEYIDD